MIDKTIKIIHLNNKKIKLKQKYNFFACEISEKNLCVVIKKLRKDWTKVSSLTF